MINNNHKSKLELLSKNVNIGTQGKCLFEFPIAFLRTGHVIHSCFLSFFCMFLEFNTTFLTFFPALLDVLHKTALVSFPPH